MELHNKPVKNVENKFVITDDGAYFLPWVDREEAPWLIEMLGKISNLGNPEVFHDVEERISEGKIIIGYYDPVIKKVEVHLPLEPNEYVEKRIREIFYV